MSGNGATSKPAARGAVEANARAPQPSSRWGQPRWLGLHDEVLVRQSEQSW